MMRSRIAAALVATAATLALGACGTGQTQDAASSTPTGSTTSPSPSTTTPSPTHSATTSAPAATSPTATHAPRTTPPTHRPVTHAPTTPAPTHRTTRPAAPRTTAPAQTTLCSIRSNAGNCYRAGQFCRNSDLGSSTTDAQGRRITCGIESGRPHWHY